MKTIALGVRQALNMVCDTGKYKLRMWTHDPRPAGASEHGTFVCAVCASEQLLSYAQCCRSVKLYDNLVDLYLAYACLKCRLRVCTDCFVKTPEGQGELNTIALGVRQAMQNTGGRASGATDAQASAP